MPKLKSVATVFTSSALLVCGISFGAQAPSSGDVVAIVEGHKITRADVRMPVESIRLKFRLQYGRYPDSTADSKLLDQLSKTTERELLMGKIRSIVWEKQVERLDILVSEQELKVRQDALLSGTDLDAALAKERERVIPLIRALKAVLTKELEEKVAYERYVSSHMSYEEWLVHVQYYNSAKRIAILEGVLSMKPDDLRKPDAGTRALIVQEKLNTLMDAEIAALDSEYAKYLEAVRLKDLKQIKEIASGSPTYVQAKRAEWWRQQYAKAQIEIIDKEYAEVLDLLLKPPASTSPNSQE